MGKFIIKFGKYVFCIGVICCLFSTSALANGGDIQFPCSTDDPTAGPCPIDTYVYLLAAVALIFTYYHLQKKKKSLAVK